VSVGPIMTDVSGVVLTDEDRELLEHPAIGGVILFSRNYVDDQQLRDLVGSVAAIRTPSLLIAIDQEGGARSAFRRWIYQAAAIALVWAAIQSRSCCGPEPCTQGSVDHGSGIA